MILVEGGWWRRVLIVPAWAAAALWWSGAMGFYPGIHGPDPVTFAYSAPTTAGLLLLLAWGARLRTHNRRGVLTV